MKITCQSCQSKYNVADEKVQGKIVKIRCRKCGATIVVQGNGGAAANGSANGSGAVGAAEADGVEWHVNVGEGEPRKMSLAELVDAYNAGTVAQDTFIWTDGMDDWKPLSEVEAVVSALHAGAVAPAPASVEAPEFRAPVAEEPAFSSRVPASAPAPAPAAAAMAAEAPAPAPEPRRAAVKREARARDLFAGGGGGEEVQTSAPAVPAMMSPAAATNGDASKLTGQRNENSVLFSLAVLTKDADGRAPEGEAPKSAAKNNEDSGLIDLKALAAKAESMRPPAVADASPFAAPLGLGGGAIGAPLGGMPSEAPAKSKLPLFIGLGAGTILLLVLGIFIGVKVVGGGAPAEASAISSAAVAPIVSAPAPEPTVTATATASATAEPTASAAASAAPKPKQAPVYHAPASATPKPQATGGAPATPAAAPPPPPKKGGSDCGCNGDLMCLMKCSTH